MDKDITFGQIVKERRRNLGLTQAELARRVGCAAITIRRIEANTLRPSVQVAELLALALNILEAEQLAFVRLARAEPGPSPIPTPAPIPEEIGQEDLSGRAIRGFQLGELIGNGGFGVVYKAVQTTVEREVAVKIILPKYANHPKFIRRFETEAQTVARLEHPHRAIFNTPENCSNDICGLDDVFLMDENGTFILTDEGARTPNLPDRDVTGFTETRATGSIIDVDGTAEFQAHLPIGDATETSFGDGLLDVMKAEVHLILRTHGPAIPGRIHEQMNTTWGGCPEGWPKTPCRNTQIAIHNAPTR